MRVLRDLVAGLVPLLAVASATAWLLGLPSGYFAATLTLYGVQAALVLRGAPDRLDRSGLGPADRVTLLRSALALPVVALAVVPGAVSGRWPGPSGDTARWWVVAASGLAMALDGFDGWLARRTGTGTSFGARWDMELDSVLLSGLSVLVWLDGRVGPWVMLIGGMRYFFVGAGRVWPVLRRELPPSLRRKTVCVVQGIALLVCLGPPVPAGVAVLAAAGALAALGHSFGADVVRLLRRDRATSAPEPLDTRAERHRPSEQEHV